MEIKKIRTLFMVAIIALGGVGIGYAMWTESVDIDVSATTGNLDFKIEQIQILDADGATITTNKVNDYEWDITVTDTYPGWKGFINILHRNAGTVSLKYESFQVLALTGPAALKNGYTITFYDPSDNPNVLGTLQEFTTKQYYDTDWGIPAAAITLIPGQGQWSKVSLDLDSGIEGFEDTVVTFTFRMWATQA